MILALGLLLGAGTVATVGPVWLRRLASPRRHPALALGAWVVSVAAVVVGVVAAAVVLLLPDPSAPGATVGLVSSCLHAAARGAAFPWVLAARLTVGLLLASAVVRLGVVAAAVARWRRVQRARQVENVDRTATIAGGVHWIGSRKPAAHSIGGRSPRIVATTGLAGLGADRCAAVLAHERAHLQGRHHLLVGVVSVVAQAWPSLPLCREARPAVGLLVEMAADAEAARRHGHHALATAVVDLVAAGARPPAAALGAVDAHDGLPPTALARLAWLDHRHGGRRWARSPAARAMSSGSALLPMVVAVATVATGVAVACHVVAG